jgi:hypothetical protein
MSIESYEALRGKTALFHLVDVSKVLSELNWRSLQ